MKTEQEESRLSLPMRLFLLGFLLVFAGVIVITAHVFLSSDANVSVGGLVFVGPIPVIFGAGADAFLMIVLAAVLALIGFVLFFLLRKQSRER